MDLKQTKILTENTMVFTNAELQSRFIFIHFGSVSLFIPREREEKCCLNLIIIITDKLKNILDYEVFATLS